MITEGRIVHIFIAYGVPVKLVTVCFKETFIKADVDNICMLYFLFRMSWKKEILYCYCIVTLP
jgi:hypothetical protein